MCLNIINIDLTIKNSSKKLAFLFGKFMWGLADCGVTMKKGGRVVEEVEND